MTQKERELSYSYSVVPNLRHKTHYFYLWTFQTKVRSFSSHPDELDLIPVSPVPLHPLFAVLLLAFFSGK